MYPGFGVRPRSARSRQFCALYRHGSKLESRVYAGCVGHPGVHSRRNPNGGSAPSERARSIRIFPKRSAAFGPGNLRSDRGRGWPAMRRLLRDPCTDVSTNFVGGQVGFGCQGTEAFVDGGQHFRGLFGQQSRGDPVGHLLHLRGAKLFQGAFDFGHGAHSGEVGGILPGGKLAVVGYPRTWPVPVTRYL